MRSQNRFTEWAHWMSSLNEFTECAYWIYSLNEFTVNLCQDAGGCWQVSQTPHGYFIKAHYIIITRHSEVLRGKNLPWGHSYLETWTLSFSHKDVQLELAGVCWPENEVSDIRQWCRANRWVDLPTSMHHKIWMKLK